LLIEFQTSITEYNQKIMNNYNDFNYFCPVCGSRHYWSRHAIYTRHFIVFEENILSDISLKILRLQCHSCNTTHAILPCDVIPYEVYSFSSILKLLSLYFLSNKSTTTISNQYFISYILCILIMA
jgi:hypothetical protein